MKKMIVIALMLVVLVGCGDKYEDTNGDDNYDLQTLKLEQVFDSYSSSYSSTSVNKSTFFTEGEKVTYKDFNGIADIYEFEQFTFGDSDCDLEISYNIESGNGALVLRDFNKIIHVFEPNKDNQTYHIEVEDETVYLTAYGETCEFTVDYVISY